MATDARHIRCAIYTRKSTEHGLKLEFNSSMPNAKPAMPISRVRLRRAGRRFRNITTTQPSRAAL